MPKSKDQYSKLLILVNAATSKLSPYPSKDLTAKTAARHIRNYILATSVPRVIAVDHGSEFKEGLDKELARMNVQLEATAPYIKSSTSTAESAIRLLKRALRKLCLYDPSNWEENLPLIVNSLNNSSLYNKVSRNQFYFSPFHYANHLNLMGLTDMPAFLFDEQWNSLQQIINTRSSNLQKTSSGFQETYKTGQLITDHYVPGTTAETSAELTPAVKGIFRIKEVFPKRLRVINVISGEERTLPTEIC